MATVTSIDISTERRTLDALGPAIARGGLIIGLIGLVAGFLTGGGVSAIQSKDWTQLEPMLRSYLVNFCFFLALALGALFFVILQHLTKAGWSVLVRRVAEGFSATLPVLALLVVPILLGVNVLFPWTGAQHWENPEEWHLIQGKASYLNVPFYLIRMVAYFLIWTLLATYFRRASIAQDATGDVGLTKRMQTVSAPGMILYALSQSFAAFDLIMSLNPKWFSTIFGVYFFAASVVSFMSLLAITLFFLQRSGRLTQTVNREHFHDVGKLAFGFTVFWAYIAFSQYMLIWYGNIPEETEWYPARQEGSWVWISLALLFGHFVVPFLALISRHPKRQIRPLVFVAGWILLMHWLDMYYLIMPNPHSPNAAHVPFSVMDVAFLIGLGGIFAAAAAGALSRASLIPERDPRLAESLAFENY